MGGGGGGDEGPFLIRIPTGGGGATFQMVSLYGYAIYRNIYFEDVKGLRSKLLVQ